MIKLKEVRTGSNRKKDLAYNIAVKFRNEMEKKWKWKDDRGCFKGTCHSISEKLANLLNKNGIYAYREHGEYFGANDKYYPDTSDWNDDDKDEYYDTWEVTGGEGMSYFHWWTVVENKWILDITADQFHPGEEKNYRVVMVNKGDKDYA